MDPFHAPLPYSFAPRNLHDLTDTAMGSDGQLVTGDFLAYDAVVGQWVPSSQLTGTDLRLQKNATANKGIYLTDGQANGGASIVVGGLHNPTEHADTQNVCINTNPPTLNRQGVFIGTNAGEGTSPGLLTTLIGFGAGRLNDAVSSGVTCVGALAGGTDNPDGTHELGVNCVCIGYRAGYGGGGDRFGQYCCIGTRAGEDGMGFASTAIGFKASAPTGKTMCLNCTGDLAIAGTTDPTTIANSNGVFLFKPRTLSIASVTGALPMYYNPATAEIFAGTTP